MQYVTKYGDNPVDVSTKLYGSSSYVVRLLSDNGIESLTDDFSVNTVLIYDEKVKTNVDNTLNRLNQINKPLDNSYKVVSRQSIFDVSTMLGYGIEEIVPFLKLSGIENLNKNNIDNLTLNVTKKRNALSEVLILNGKVLCTSLPEDVVPDLVRITEDEIYRLTEDSEFRIIE